MGSRRLLKEAWSVREVYLTGGHAFEGKEKSLKLSEICKMMIEPTVPDQQ